MFEKMNEEISKLGVIPVIVIEDAKNAVPLAEALEKAGLKCAEVTFRTDAAEESIRQISEHFPDMLVGAGTVLTKENVDKAVAAGAKFIVSPVFDPEIVDYCIEKNVPIYPGCATSSEIMQGIKRGLGIVKFFPAADLGGAVTIKAIASALRGVKFMPTGGINRDNMRDYLSMDCVAAIGGSWMCKSGFISNGEFDRIEKLTREALYSADKIREEKHS